MNWYSIGIGAAAGAFAGLIGSAASFLPIGNEKTRKYISVALILVLFSVFNTVAQDRILPRLEQRHAAEEFDEFFSDTPTFQTIRKLEPESYEAMKLAYVEAVGDGLDVVETQHRIRSQLSALISRRLPKASDEAIVTYIGVVGDQMAELQEAGGDQCFRLLFPAVDGSIDATNAFSDALQARDMAALEMTITSFEESRYIPADDEALPILTPVYQAVFAEFGQAAATALENPAAETVDRDLLCTVIRSLYARILTLPREDTVTALRWMLSKS